MCILRFFLSVKVTFWCPVYKKVQKCKWICIFSTFFFCESALLVWASYSGSWTFFILSSGPDIWVFSEFSPVKVTFGCPVYQKVQKCEWFGIFWIVFFNDSALLVWAPYLDSWTIKTKDFLNVYSQNHQCMVFTNKYISFLQLFKCYAYINEDWLSVLIFSQNCNFFYNFIISRSRVLAKWLCRIMQADPQLQRPNS